MLTKGDILKGERIIHPVVYLDNYDEYNFTACMLTHSTTETYTNNILLKQEHFETNEKNGVEYELKFDDTYFVKLKLIKEAGWGPYKKVGKLTTLGISFLEKHLKEVEPTKWRKYMAKAS